ncbi:hypothetical protein V8E36_005920 [Tilletia maclaganii]
MPRLEVLVGPDRFSLEPCRVNDSHRPHEIKTEHFIGRVLVRIVDFDGARPGEPGREYFRDRSRKFSIQIEGRFTKPWNGNEVLFGTDFDKLIDFPRTAFNAGMKVAQWVDPCTFYEEKPPSGRPYIMSPYVACMNTLAAWPAPHREHDAVVVLRDVVSHEDENSADTPKRQNTPLPPILDDGRAAASSPLTGAPPAIVAAVLDDIEGDIVPVESLEHHAKQDEGKGKKRKNWFGGLGGKKEEERKAKRYWRFVGFKDDVRVRAFLEAHDAHLEKQKTGSAPAVSQSTEASAAPSETQASQPEVQHAPGKPTLSRLGTFSRKQMTEALRNAEGDGTGTHTPEPDFNASNSGMKQLGDEIAAMKLKDAADKHPDMPPLERISTHVRTEMKQAAKKDGLVSKDFKLADEVHHQKMTQSNSSDGWKSKLDDELGPWRFSDPSTDMLEDNAFIFTNQSLPVPRRRRHFANQKNRLEFKYDPDVVYAASFFTPFCDLNTFDLDIGPVHLNITRFFKDMPIRYTLRAADESITFATISFQIVD